MSRFTVVVVLVVAVVLTPYGAGEGRRAQASPTVSSVASIVQLPVVGAIVRRFEAPFTDYGPGHRGVKIAAAAGTQVRAAGDGVVHHAGPVAGIGWVTIDHGKGVLSSYGPVAARVIRGDAVVAGQTVGVVTGASATMHDGVVHWGVRQDGQYVDPLVWMYLGQPSLVDGGRTTPVLSGRVLNELNAAG
ncbi:MAG: M23 family metallopeptidase [Nitriliruptoraceae bacterium]